jgi:menaquinone-dependent protoporphyrinogen oxidase
MSEPILVAYATRSGSTAEVAQAITADFREQGIVAELHPAKEVLALQEFGALVLCVPLYLGRFHADARRFLSAHRAAISQMPVALIVLGPVQQEANDWAGARSQLEKQLARHPWLAPVACEIVGGRFDPALLGFPYTMLPALKKMPASDTRDWTAIHALARKLPAKLRLAVR